MDLPLWQKVTPDVLTLETLASEPHQSSIGAYWATIQLLNHIFATSSCYDPATGQSTSQSLHKTLKNLAKSLEWGERPLPEDSLYRTAEFGLGALEDILQGPRQKLIRQHLLMPLYKIREMDGQCMAHLAKQPGRNAREKIAIQERTLGVQREISANTLENQMVQRLLFDMRPQLKQRICLAEHYSDTEENSKKMRIMEKVYNLCQQNTPLKNIAPATIIKPNNVLLSDRRYNKIWRALQAFHKHRNEISQIWASGQFRFVTSVFWLILAEMWERTAPIFDDSFCLLHPGFYGDAFGITPLENSHGENAHIDWKNWQNPYVDVLVPWDYHCYYLSVACQDNRILMESNRMEYDNHCGMEIWQHSRRESMQYEVQLMLDPDGQKEEYRYCPYKAVMLRNGKLIASWKDFADIRGLQNLSDRIWEQVFRTPHRDYYRWENKGTLTVDQPKIPWMGLDLSGSKPRIFSDGECKNPNIPTYGISFELPDKTIDWIIGHQTPLLPNSKYCEKIIALNSVFEEKDSNDENLWTKGLQRIASNFGKRLSSTHIQLAIAIPDTLDELAFQMARATFTPVCDKLYFLWRSVAGALGWQRESMFHSYQIQSGDVVVVMDAEAPIWTTICLLARYDRRLENTSAYGIYWERKPPLIPIPEGENLTYKGLLQDYLRRTLKTPWIPINSNDSEERSIPEDLEDGIEDLISHIISTGLAERLIDEELPIWITLPPELVPYFQHDMEKDSVWLKLYFDREIWKQATQVWYVRFKDWLYNWKFSEQVQEIKQYAGNKSIYFLFVGRPFHKKWLRETITYYLEHHFDAISCYHYISDASQDIVAQGAWSFLERVQNNLPTYEDWLPDLYLQVLDNGIPNYIQIFEGRTARPGQEIFYDVPKTLELPAHQSSYRIPLVRDRNSRRPLLYAARLESPAFPLKRPVTVSMQVWYRYGEDSYRLIVCPKDSRQTAFKEIEVKWVRGAEHNRDSSQPRKNLPPNFPSKESWDVYELQQYSQWFLEAGTDLYREANQIFSVSFFRSHRFDYIGRYLENFSRLLEKKLLPPCKRLLHYNKEISQIPADVVDTLRDKVIPWLVKLSGLASDDFQNNLKLLAGSNNIYHTLQHIQQVSLEVLSLLGPETPQVFLDHLLEKFSDPTKDREVCYMFGRVIGNGQGERRPLVLALLEELRHRFEDNNHYSEDRSRNKVGYRYLLWAIATALWRNSDFILTLRECGFVRLLLKIVQHDCHSLLYTLQKANLSPKYQINYLSYFRSISEILLGLLRLRGQEGDHFLHAGNRRMSELAFFLHQIDALFLKSGHECKSCFKFECVQKHEGMSEIIHVVTSYLTGEEYSGLIKIKKIEESIEESEF